MVKFVLFLFAIVLIGSSLGSILSYGKVLRKQNNLLTNLNNKLIIKYGKFYIKPKFQPKIKINYKLYNKRGVKLVQIKDGDTIAIKIGLRIIPVRILMLDTPETFRPKCSQEHEWGTLAKIRLTELLLSNNVVINIDLKLRTRGKRKGQPILDRYNRLLGYVYSSGKLVNVTLIDEGLGRKYSGKGRRLGWCNDKVNKTNFLKAKELFLESNY